jgi:transposase InsO family protein
MRTWLGTRAQLQLEILALRHQVTVLRRQRKARAPLTSFDRAFWVWLYRLWPGCLDALVIVKPETVVRWHREGFRRYWRWKSRAGRPGRPAISPDIRKLIARMSQENPLWGAPRIHGEMLKLGIEISQASVSKYMTRHPRPPSQTWRAFFGNHVGCLASIDFFTVPTVSFAVLFVFIVLRHERRRVVHFGITTHPTAPWIAQQLREAFPWDSAPRHVIRDRDGAYGAAFRATVKAMYIEEVVTAPRSPWQNPYVERVIGSIRRECLNHVIVLNEGHLRQILSCYLDYYHGARTHLSLGKDSPEPRSAQPPGPGKIVVFPQVGGLHHRYDRLAA